MRQNVNVGWGLSPILLVMILSAMCVSGEIAYQDYLSESELLSPQDREADAWILTSFDWNYFFESNSLAVALKIKYGEGPNTAFRPIVVRYDFNGVREPVDKSIRRSGTCYRDLGMVCGFCMVGLDSFLFSYGQRQCPKTAFMCISDSTQAVVEITRDVNGMPLRGALSASERAVFPDGEGYAFQCAIGKPNDWGLLLWNKGVGALWPVPSRLKGYTCLSGGRVLFDVSSVGTDDPRYRELVAHCYRILPDGDINVAPTVYADWDAALSNKIISSGRTDKEKYDWSVELHGMKARSSDNELGHEFVEGQDVLYDFFRWKIFRIRKNDPDWQVFDLEKFFSEDIDRADDSVPMSVLHRGLDSWYYALLFECKKRGDDSNWRYRMKIVEVSRKSEKIFVWSFPEWNTTKKLTTYLVRSPGVVHKLQDDSCVHFRYVYFYE